MTKTVPFNDLTRIHNPIEEKIMNKFSKIVKKNSFVLNKEVEEFENMFSKFSNSNFTIGCANGTDAIELILRGLGIGVGDEVIIPTNSYIATAYAVSRTGAKPVFVDNDEFYLINTNEVKKKISKKTKAIIAVNLYGQKADLKTLAQISKQNSLYLIEDSAQSHGARNSKFSNNYSIGAAYSFYPGKNLGAWGDGGAVTTDNKKLYEKMKLIRNQGSIEKYIHPEIGFNSRLQPLQGVVLSEKIKKLASWNKLRNEVADIYFEKLKKIDSIVLPKVRDGNSHVWHLFVIRTKNRDKILNEFTSHKVEFGIHYPIPIHRQKAYKDHKQFNSKIKNADNYGGQLLSLPIFPHMKNDEINRVVSVLEKYHI